MTVDDLIPILDDGLASIGAESLDGEDHADPPLSVLRYYALPCRLGPIPLLGRALGVVAVARTPVDLPDLHDVGRLLDRLARAVDGRFPPFRRGGGLSIGLTALLVTSGSIQPGDDAAIASALTPRTRRSRAFPIGAARVNVAQGAMAHALLGGPPGAFAESAALIDLLTPHLGRFVPLAVI